MAFFRLYSSVEKNFSFSLKLKSSRSRLNGAEEITMARFTIFLFLSLLLTLLRIGSSLPFGSFKDDFNIGEYDLI